MIPEYRITTATLRAANIWKVLCKYDSDGDWLQIGQFNSEERAAAFVRERQDQDDINASQEL